MSNFIYFETEFANRAVRPSKSCRFCKKSLTCSRSKVPRVSVFNVVENRELLAYTGMESVVLADLLDRSAANGRGRKFSQKLPV